MKTMKWMFVGLLMVLVSAGVAFAGGFPTLAPSKITPKRQLYKPTVPAAQPQRQLNSQLKLTFKQFGVDGTGRSGRYLGEQVMSLLEVENQGRTTERVRVHYMVGRNPTTDSTGALTLHPGQKLSAVVHVHLPNSSQSSDHNIHFDQRNNYMWWSPAFAIRKLNGAPFVDANMTDNAVGPSDGFRVSIVPKVDVQVTSIERIKMTETWHGGGSVEEGAIHPVSLDAVVKVKNNGSQNSRPMTLSVNIISTKEAITIARGKRKASYLRVGSCASWPQCSTSQDITIAAIRAGETVSFPVHFAPIPHSIERAKHTGKIAGGPYACGRFKANLSSHAKISAALRTADEDVAFRHNNSLSKEGKFGTAPSGDTVTCGFE